MGSVVCTCGVVYMTWVGLHRPPNSAVSYFLAYLHPSHMRTSTIISHPSPNSFSLMSPEQSASQKAKRFSFWFSVMSRSSRSKSFLNSSWVTEEDARPSERRWHGACRGQHHVLPLAAARAEAFLRSAWSSPGTLPCVPGGRGSAQAVAPHP